MIVVVGGHSRNIGKTSVVAGLIRALPEAEWTAVKITQHGHGICSVAGEPCDCAIECEAPYALSRQQAPDDTDSGRYLAAGAARAYWLRTETGQLRHALPALERILASGENSILESNSVMRFVQPDLYLLVVDPAVNDWKESSRRYLERADAVVWIDRGTSQPLSQEWPAAKPRFRTTPPRYVSEDLVTFLRQRFATRSRS